MRKRLGSPKKIEPSTEALARDIVNRWIEQGMMTYDMKERAAIQVLNFQDFLIRDIDLYARSGKYPKYAEQEHAKETGVTALPASSKDKRHDKDGNYYA